MVEPNKSKANAYAKYHPFWDFVYNEPFWPFYKIDHLVPGLKFVFILKTCAFGVSVVLKNMFKVFLGLKKHVFRCVFHLKTDV